MKVKLTGLLVGVVVLGLASTAIAVPYASGINKVGDNVSFILNQNAWSVNVILDGGAQTLNLGTQVAAGQHSFNMAGYSTYQIVIRSYQSSGWNQYIADGFDRNFYTPIGVSIDKNPLSANFGKVFVSNATSATTGAGRNTPEGIYMLRADGVAAGFGNGGVTWGGTLGPGKSTIGPDGHLYVADTSLDLCFEMSYDLQSATQLIDASNKANPVGNANSGQYVNSIIVEGTQAAGNRKIYLVNGNYYDTARKGLISYDLGGNARATAGDTGTQVIGPPSMYGFYGLDVARDSKGDFYLSTYRSAVNQAPPIMKFNGAGTLPLDDDKIWEASMAYAGSPYGIDINENAGLVAYVRYDDGKVYLFDMATGGFLESFTPGAGNRGRELAFDPAGNLVVVNSSSEYARFWSPGGAWETVYGSDGTFSVTIVPEPTTLSLLALGGVALLLRRRR